MFGNVAQFACEKATQLGAKVVTMSDLKVIHDHGIDGEKLAWIMDLKNNRRGRIKEYADHFDGVTFHENENRGASKLMWHFMRYSK